MKIYWHWSDVPELAGLSQTDRRKVVRSCFFQFGFGLWQFWIGQAAIFICVVLGSMTGIFLEDVLGFPFIAHLVSTVVGVLVGCSIYGWIYYGVILEKLRPCFRDYLQSHRVYQPDEPNADTTPRRLS